MDPVISAVLCVRFVALALRYKLKTFYIDQTIAAQREVILEGTSTGHWEV